MRLGRALALWAAATLVVVLLTWSAKLAVGLPTWALPVAIGVMCLGLPVILFTAYFQRTAYRQFTRTPTLTSDGRPELEPVRCIAALVRGHVRDLHRLRGRQDVLADLVLVGPLVGSWVFLRLSWTADRQRAD